MITNSSVTPDSEEFYDLTKSRIVKGDCLVKMKNIPDGSIDCIFSDLPFYQDLQQFETNLKGNERKVASYIEWNKKLAVEFDRVLKKGGNLVIVNSAYYMLRIAHVYFEKFLYRGEVSLERKGAFRPAWMLGFQHNQLLMLCKGTKKLKWNGARTPNDKTSFTDVWDDIPYQNMYRGKGVDSMHPEAINIEIVERSILLNSNETDMVLDATAGSGTTAIACIDNNRKYICIEKSEKYFRVLRKRVNEHRCQLDIENFKKERLKKKVVIPPIKSRSLNA